MKEPKLFTWILHKGKTIYLYLINDEQHSEEIAECEINHTQAIRFLKATKLLIF